MLHIQYFKAIERSKQWLQTDLNSEPDSIITRASDLPPLSRLFISEMGTTNAFLMGFCEEQIRRGCKMLGAASCLFSRHCRVQTKRSKCPPNNLSLRLSSPWYDKHLILVKGSFWSGFPFMQRLKDARVTQVQLLFRLAKGGHGMLRAFVPHPAPPPPRIVLSLPFTNWQKAELCSRSCQQPRWMAWHPRNSASGSSQPGGCHGRPTCPVMGVMCHSFWCLPRMYCM